jgi:hypothetical protein
VKRILGALFEAPFHFLFVALYVSVAAFMVFGLIGGFLWVTLGFSGNGTEVLIWVSVLCGTIAGCIAAGRQLFLRLFRPEAWAEEERVSAAIQESIRASRSRYRGHPEAHSLDDVYGGADE